MRVSTQSVGSVKPAGAPRLDKGGLLWPGAGIDWLARLIRLFDSANQSKGRQGKAVQVRGRAVPRSETTRIGPAAATRLHTLQPEVNRLLLPTEQPHLVPRGRNRIFGLAEGAPFGREPHPSHQQLATGRSDMAMLHRLRDPDFRGWSGPGRAGSESR